MNSQIIEFQKSLFNKFQTNFDSLLININSHLNKHNIQLLNYFNKNFISLIEDLKELNELLTIDEDEPIVQNKIKQYLLVNQKINELLPALIMETI